MLFKAWVCCYFLALLKQGLYLELFFWQGVPFAKLRKDGVVAKLGFEMFL